jgi:3-deoxy-manno-octulosonate cytidylyltransferase (CMP-KDO synthetase)
MKVVAVIPAHLASVRFPKKILFDIHGLPMIEHVRRRALLSKELDDVVVATCDKEIVDAIKSYGGKVIMTSNTHKNGTSRVAEAIQNYDCSHVLLLQGDEPLLLPRHIDSMISAMKGSPDVESWNATGSINSEDELDRNSFVKCSVLENNRILNCFRKTPYVSELEVQQKFVRKILGIIGYRKDFLLKLNQLDNTPIETAEFIEQMRIIERNFPLYSVNVNPSLPSINEPHEANIVLDYLKEDEEQKSLLEKILKSE